MNDLIIRRVTVDRTRTPRQMLNATRRQLYINRKVVKSMPRGDGTEVDVIFFEAYGALSNADLKKEYALQGFIPVDPYELAAANEADPGFADDHPNATHWQDENGQWWYISFSSWRDERRLNVDYSNRLWRGRWWFAGKKPV